MKKRVNPRTSYLFTEPSALDGVARTFDFFGVYDSYNVMEPAGVADVLGFIQDLLVVEEQCARFFMSAPQAENVSAQKKSTG